MSDVPGEDAVSVCPPCAAYLGGSLASEVGECDRHHAAVQALARALAVAFQGEENPSTEQVGWYIEDATEVAEAWPPDRIATVVDLGEQRDGRRHLTIDGERWATPDPSAEGFNPLSLMTACPHPFLLAEDDPEWWPFDDEDTPCEFCLGTGWTSYTAEELTQFGSRGSEDAR